MNEPTAREIVVRLLLRHENAREFIEEALADEFGRTRLSPEDRGLVQELTYGLIRWERTLDWLIERKTPPRRTQKALLQILLRLGLYQLFWLERIPDHAAVHETVALAKQLGFGPQAGFVNAVLRSYQREREEAIRLLRELRLERPALARSHPDWLFERWTSNWGQDKAIALLEWNNQPPGVFVRVNRLRTTATDLMKLWDAEKVSYEPVRRDWLQDDLVFELKAHPRLSELSTFRDGLFYVQDPSTLLAVQELDPRPGEVILDLCAAPGGKTTYIAQRMENRGRIVAQDTDPQRLQLLRENCARLGVGCVETTQRLESRSDCDSKFLFDRVLVDAPCSNTGVMRRRVDLRWRIRLEELNRLSRTQLSLLQSAAVYLKPGGRMVYSTCSLEPEENRQVIDSFLKAHPSFRLENDRTLLPFGDQVDGGYVARMVRSNDPG